MNPAAYLKSLLPTFSKDKVAQDLVITREEFENHVKPNYVSFKERFKNTPLQSEQMIEFQQRYVNVVKAKPGTNWVVSMWDECLSRIPNRIDLLERTMSDNMTGQLTTSAMTARELNLTQAAEILSFMTRYARRFLTLVVESEIKHLNVSRSGVGDNLKQAEKQWILNNFTPFLHGLNFLYIKKESVQQMYDDIPDVLVNTQNINEVTAISGDKVDPFGFGIIPVKLNPVYHIGMRIAEYQAARYHEAQAEHNSLATKIMYLKRRADGKNDARLEAMIERYDALLAKKAYELAKMEERYGMGD